jgi:hypothetical protein
MTDLERKLAETLRGQAGEVTPNLDAAWEEQQRRQRRPVRRRRRAAVWGAPLAAVLMVLTSVLLATQLNRSPAPLPPANRVVELNLAGFAHQDIDFSSVTDVVELTDFVGQTGSWTAFAFQASVLGTGAGVVCIAAVPAGEKLRADIPQYGTKSPQCIPAQAMTAGEPVTAGYVGEIDGPLPPGKAVYFLDARVQNLQLFDRSGDLASAWPLGQRVRQNMVFLADVTPSWPPVRAKVS